ncbi:MAG: ABC transporter permease [Oscillospiraceae bacterium]|jgi:ABC-2 type transport system permease protein|nr:ABC transporter permease [Oscillospiraceae bacterium]
MLNFTLFRREMKGSLKILAIFAAIMTLYVSVIISMYDPDKMALLDGYTEIMPGIMAAVGMKAGNNTLLGFMSSYLYGFILVVFPMLFSILRANGLVARYADKGALVTLLAAPVKRRTVARTQLAVLGTGVFLLLAYATMVELVCARKFPGQLEVGKLLLLNTGVLCLEACLAGICFLASCLFSDAKYSIGFGAGIPALMFLLQMLANAAEKAEKLKYASAFTLFNPDGLIGGEPSALVGVLALAIGAAALCITAVEVFARRDLHI